jgi:putative ABC transport system ATP-binding protein
MIEQITNKVKNMVEQIVNESSADGDTVIDVRKSYQIGGMEIPILNGIDLTIRSGEFLAIMGPSGSGERWTNRI